MEDNTIFLISVPDNNGNHVTHFVKWNQTHDQISVWIGEPGGIQQVGSGSPLDYEPNPDELYMVQEEDGSIHNFRMLQYFPYAEEVQHPAEGTFLRNQCYGYDLYQVVADGNGGERQEALVEANSATCGYTPPVECVATKAFTIKAERGPRFFMVWKDSLQRQNRLEWVQPGYTGEPEELRGGKEPLKITAPGLGNKIDVLSGSGATIEILVERYGLLEELYTTDEREYQVNHYIDGQLNWRGYHMADIYHEPLVAVPFHATVEAYDGIGGLDNMPYLSQSGERFYGRARSIDIIFRCLRLLDLELPVWLAINVWEDTMDLNVEPLSQSYADQSGYYNEENEPLSCKEVLVRILKPYNACIRQAKGTLHILRYEEAKGPYRRRKATIGQGDTQVQVDLEAEDFEEVHVVLRQGEVSYREKSQDMASLAAYKRVTTKTEYGEYENFVVNGEMELWLLGKPMFWEFGEGLEVEQVQDKGKFMLGFPNSIGSRSRNEIPSMLSNVYTYAVRSDVGFTFSFDYSVTIEDYLEKDGIYWVELPEFTLEGNSLYLDNAQGREAKGMFTGVEKIFPNRLIKDGIPVPADGVVRIDTVYASADGFITYIVGTPPATNTIDYIVPEPDDALLVTYITWEGAQAEFSSFSSLFYVDFPFDISIGAYKAYSPRYIRENRGRFTRLAFNPDNPNNTGVWGTNQLSGNPTLFRVTEFDGGDGYASASGTYTFHINPLSVEGLPSVRIYNPYVRRSSMRGVQVLIDNIRFQERQLDGIERMLITGENKGHINTPPLEVELHHGSGIPRTQALLTLADGSPAKTWNGGYLLQELTARSILAQHPRASQVLSATLTGPVSPISVLKDPFKPNSRFLVDRYVYDAKRALTEVTAIEVFGGAEELPPENARVTENGQPRVTESFDYRIIEG